MTKFKRNIIKIILKKNMKMDIISTGIFDKSNTNMRFFNVRRIFMILNISALLIIISWLLIATGLQFNTN